jgi:hypothetical protein
MCFDFQDSWAFILWRIHVHGNAVHSLRRGREHVPALLLFYECEKIILSFDIKLQFAYLISMKKIQPRITRISTDV